MLPAAAAFVAAAALGFPATAGAAVQARQADAFVDSIGVGVHTAYTDTPYASAFSTVVNRLQELGVRHVRDDLFPDRADQYERLDGLAAAGVGSTLIVGSPADEDELGGLLSVVGELDRVDAVEGPNEYSTMGGDPDWVPHLTAYQEDLYEQVQDDAELSALPVIGPSIVAGHQDELGDVSAHLDFGNIHSYPQGEPPDKLGSAINRAKLNSGSKPIMATETGYNNALAWTGENRPVPEGAAATYMPRLFLEYWRWGIARTFSYELLDEFENDELDEAESHFGLLRHDLSRKPAFDALRNTIAILEDPGAPFAPASVDLTVSEDGVVLEEPGSPGLHKVLLQKRDGSFYLALWRTTSVWDPDSGVALPAPSSPVEITLEPGLEAVTEYRPNSSAGPLRVVSEPAQPFEIEVGPAVVILRLLPGTAQPEPESPPEPQPLPGPDATTQGEGPGEPVTPVRCLVPTLKGRTVAGARRALKGRRCTLGTVAGQRRRSSRVAGQRPRPGRVLPVGAPVNVRIRLGG